jgi:hypothetical protein
VGDVRGEEEEEEEVLVFMMWWCLSIFVGKGAEGLIGLL